MGRVKELLHDPSPEAQALVAVLEAADADHRADIPDEDQLADTDREVGEPNDRNDEAAEPDVSNVDGGGPDVVEPWPDDDGHDDLGGDS